MQYEHIWQGPEAELDASLLQLLAVGTAPGIVWGQLKAHDPEEEAIKGKLQPRPHTERGPVINPSFPSILFIHWQVKPQHICGYVPTPTYLVSSKNSIMLQNKFTIYSLLTLDDQTWANVTCSSLVYS